MDKRAQPQHVGSYSAEVAARHGRFRYLLQDLYIGRSLALYGEYSEGEVQLFEKFVKPGDIVIDAGANIGAHTVALARLVGEGGAVLAYEPQRLIFQLLCANVALNELTNVFCFHAGLGAARSTVAVPVLDVHIQQNFGALRLGEHDRGDPIEIKALDGIGVPRCDFLKADIEGMELAMLKGGREFISTHRPTLYLEAEKKDDLPELQKLLTAHGYCLFWHFSPYFSERNFFGNPDNVFGDIRSRNILAVHESNSVQIEGMQDAGGIPSTR